MLFCDVNFSDLAKNAQNIMQKDSKIKNIIQGLKTQGKTEKQKSVQEIDKTEGIKELEDFDFKNIAITPKQSVKEMPVKKKSSIKQRKPILFKMKTSKNKRIYFYKIKSKKQKLTTNKLIKAPVKKITLKETSQKKISSNKLLEMGADKKHLDAYKNIFKTSKHLTSNKLIQNSIANSFYTYIDAVTKNKNINIFFFADSSMGIDSYIRFSKEIEKLRKYNRHITGRILVNGLIISKEDKSKIKNQIQELKIILKQNKKNSPEYNNTLKKIKKLEFKKEGSFDSYYRWATSLYKRGVRGVKIQFHSAAFKEMKLNRVPAYLLSRCEPDFRFKTCKHIALIRGNISLATFYKVLSQEKKEYRGAYQALLYSSPVQKEK